MIFFATCTTWKKELIKTYKDEGWFDADDNSIVEQILDSKRNIYRPTTSHPFKFFEWFFNGKGFILFVDYFANFPLVASGASFINDERIEVAHIHFSEELEKLLKPE